MTKPAPVVLAGSVLPVLILAAIGGVWWDLDRRATARDSRTLAALEDHRREIAQLEAAIQFLRIEQKSESKGVHGVIEQIELWADVLCDSTSSEVHHSDARDSMDAALRAVGALGQDAFPAIYDALVDAPDELETLGACVDVRRRWLLAAAAEADPERAVEVAARFLRGRDPELRVTPRMRWLAADILIELDRQVAAYELRGILTTESARGVNPNLVRGALPHSRSMSGFSNFISRYLKAEDPEQDATLLQVISGTEHDMITKQECIKALGASKSRDAVPFIQELFANPPEIGDNAVFKNHCIHAIASILGREACPWLQDMFSSETNERVVHVLRDQIVKLGCN